MHNIKFEKSWSSGYISSDDDSQIAKEIEMSFDTHIDEVNKADM
jgi:hypothetical protein